MIKAAFFDIDGTLVSFKTHRVPQSTIDAIHRIRQKGVKTFIATGRSIPFVDNLEGVEFDGIMSVNGACTVLYDGMDLSKCDLTKDGTVLVNKLIPAEDIERVIADSHQHPMPISFTGRQRAIVCNLDSAREELLEVFELLDIPIPESQPIEEARNMEVLQMVAFFRTEEEHRLLRDVMKGCSTHRWHPYFADCICKGVNKATGIDDICRHYGIDLADTIAFGDGGNDIEMLEHVGIGVAMGSASDEVKQHADMVTASVDEDGIAKVLNQLF